jgi:ABC-2 type transport system ATP-binding protein
VTRARTLKPIHERQSLGRSVVLFDGVERAQLAALGDVRTPSIADLFIAVMSSQPSFEAAGQVQGATR